VAAVDGVREFEADVGDGADGLVEGSGGLGVPRRRGVGVRAAMAGLDVGVGGEDGGLGQPPGQVSARGPDGGHRGHCPALISFALASNSATSAARYSRISASMRRRPAGTRSTQNTAQAGGSRNPVTMLAVTARSPRLAKSREPGRPGAPRTTAQARLAWPAR